ncbi:hypothetical protein QAD02_006149 [Eretmocerus hayati]|uniref:Uncharacterized protein n=1 Tax=Eretmocerus hayati TaxID=131215 RepID=A0ACC2N0A7_9HYME|nr:hypothetical protein QAD02_006149 [Eretmocerus hayati]
MKNIHIFHTLSICLQIAFLKAEPLAGGPVRIAKTNEFQSVVSIGKKHGGPNLQLNQLCTGTVITKRHVLATARCLENKNANDLEVFGGSANISQCTKYSVMGWMNYNDFIFHDKRRAFEQPDYNIAIIMLSEPVDMVKTKPALLASQNIGKYYSQTASTAGWGTTVHELNPEMMHTANLLILSKSECVDATVNVTRRKEAILRDKIICTLIPPVLSEVDAGGPLLYRNEILIAINMHFPFDYQWLLGLRVNFHISLSRYIDFIRAITSGETLTMAP